MAIFINNKTNTFFSIQQMLKGKFTHFKPQLIEQILTRFDFEDRRFSDLGALEKTVRDTAMEEATDIGGLLTMTWKQAPFFAQFKKITITEVESHHVLQFQQKVTSNQSNDLKNEALVLRQLELMGLRVVPVYGDVVELDSVQTMFEKLIQGNFIDLYKEKFGQDQQITFLATFLGLQVPTGEAKVFQMKGIKSKVDTEIKNGWLPCLASIYTAIDDFSAIQKTLKTHGISDLQGILEFSSGKFFIADPLAVVEMRDILVKEQVMMKTASDNVDNILIYLRSLTTHVMQESQKQVELQRKKMMMQVIPKN